LEDTVAEFRRGAAEICLRTKPLIIPIAMRTRGKKMILVIGKPYHTSGVTVEDINAEMHTSVNTLYQAIV
jgi:hypothetical protein